MRVPKTMTPRIVPTTGISTGLVPLVDCSTTSVLIVTTLTFWITGAVIIGFLVVVGVTTVVTGCAAGAVMTGAALILPTYHEF